MPKRRRDDEDHDEDEEADPEPWDGSPALLYLPTLFPSAYSEITSLADRAVLAITEQLHLAANDSQPWLRPTVIHLVNDFFRHRRYVTRPTAENYRNQLEATKKATEHLLSQIRKIESSKRAETRDVADAPNAEVDNVVGIEPTGFSDMPRDSKHSVPRHELWALDSVMRRKIGMPLWKHGHSETTFEGLLEQVIVFCDSTSGRIQGARGARGQPDLFSLVAGLADIWSRLTGKRFTKNVTPIIGVEGMADPKVAEFKMPGPRFVSDIVRIFDPNIAFSEIRTALKSLQVNRVAPKLPTRRRPKSGQVPR
jgi:hypothetical protein